jgi:flavin reductase (DIM6/NTAB) family NADH-FMN oxidoreductase RutF
VTFECRTLQVIRMAPGREGASNLLVGEVVRVHVADGLANERMHLDADRLAAVGRMGGSDYCTTRERGAIPAGRAALGHVVDWR